MIDPTMFNFDKFEAGGTSNSNPIPKKSFVAPLLLILFGVTAIGIGIYLYNESQKSSNDK